MISNQYHKWKLISTTNMANENNIYYIIFYYLTTKFEEGNINMATKNSTYYYILFLIFNNS